MEDSVSEAPVPSDSILEVETWVKLSNFPAKFLTIEAISFIASSFGSLVATDDVTFEKVVNHNRPPKLRRKLHSRKTFITALVSVNVTKPLPSLVAVGCTKGREYIIRLEFEDPPVLVVDPLILPPVPGIVGAAASDLQPEGTVFTQGSESCEDCPALEVDPPILQPAPCTFGAAVSGPQPEEGDLAAVQTTSDGFDVTSKQLSGVFHKWRDFSVDHGLLADGSGTGVGLLGVVLGLWCDNLDDQGMFSFDKLDLLQMLSRLVWNLAATYFEQVCFLIYHKWRDKGH